MTFTELGLSQEVLKAVADAGYTEPTPIQAQAIPYVLMGRDVLGCAQTGTGKTASFTLPMIDILASGRARARMPRSLILCPTRELAAQVSENFETYGKYHKLSMALLIGGSSFADQEKRLDRGVDVLIATPGRLLDLFERGKILLADVKVLVIDEADRMLDMGFIPDVERIVSRLPKIRQTLFFSATMPPEIRRLADAFLMNPKEVSVSPQSTAAETVQQSLVRVRGDQRDKRAALRAFLRREDVASALIFCNRKKDVDTLFKSLRKHDFSVAALHGDMAQPVRMETLGQFKNGEVRLLVCSDVAARGLDIPKVSHVFNFDVPVNAEDYVHRIGRTGRAGRSGIAVSLALPEEAKALAAVTEMLGRDIPETALEDVEGWDAAEAEDSAGGRRRGGRRRDGERGRSRARGGRKDSGRGKEGSRRRQAQGEPASEQPAEEHGEAPAAGADESAQDSTAPQSEGATRRKPRNQPSTAQDHPFGEHAPAFLFKALKVA
jgi:superfamily II DNA/RNA helicase